MNKQILIASFIFQERVEWFLNHLHSKFNIPNDRVFCYKNLDDESKVIMTFKLEIPSGIYLNLKDNFPGALIIHKKGNALYTINALNKIIDETMIDFKGNIDYKDIKIDWESYQNKLMLIKGGELGIFTIERVF